MNHSNEDHLLRLHAYLLRTGCDRPGMNVIKTGILSRCRTEFLADKMDPNKMCLHCFHHWSEGDFFLKFKSRKSKRKKNVKLYVWKIKCSNCGKHTQTTREKPPNESYHLSQKKTISAVLETFQPQKTKKNPVKNLERLKKSHRIMKSDKILPQTEKQKKQSKNLLPKKKSNLSYLKDLL